MPKHDDVIARNVDEHLNDIQAQKVEDIAKVLAEHLYARPITSEQDEQDDCTIWEHTSEENKRIFRSCALDIYENFVR